MNGNSHCNQPSTDSAWEAAVETPDPWVMGNWHYCNFSLALHTCPPPSCSREKCLIENWTHQFDYWSFRRWRIPGHCCRPHMRTQLCVCRCANLAVLGRCFVLAVGIGGLRTIREMASKSTWAGGVLVWPVRAEMSSTPNFHTPKETVK